MIKEDGFAFEQPSYAEAQDKPHGRDMLILSALAEANLFPISSKLQGSAFTEAFEYLAEESGVLIVPMYEENYEEKAKEFEKNAGSIEEKALFAVYYEENPYSDNDFLYPSFFENKIYIIMPSDKEINIKTKEDLKNFKGVYAKTDKFPKYLLKNLASLNVDMADDYSLAFKSLLTGRADYMVASYYPSVIAAYKLGIREYVRYSKEAVWKASMFLKMPPVLLESSRVKYMKKYLKSDKFKQLRDNALEDVIEIYRKNTEGVVPPTYLGVGPDNAQTKDD
jgi:ABC-type amino acid transport substrate-binding protein